MIESGFNPVAVSRAGAKGLWQFMAPTARRYGLRIDDWLDERLDPEKSTMAAARHLLDLYAVFGSWNLVQAAYNAGETRVVHAIRAMGSSASGRSEVDRSSGRDQELHPAIQAATLIAREPERYGFVFTPAEPLSYEVVMAPRGTSLSGWPLGRTFPIDVFEQLTPSSSSSRLHLTARIAQGAGWRGQARPGGPRARGTPSPCDSVIARAGGSSRQSNSAADGARRQAQRDRGCDREALRRVRG